MTLVPNRAGSLVGRTRAPDPGRWYQVPGRTDPRSTARPRDLGYPVDMPRPLASGLLAVAARPAVLVACAGGAAASFDPTGPCKADGSAPGAYPALEALIPTTYRRRARPRPLDSGRNCTPENLGSLAAPGITEVDFAGGDLDVRCRTAVGAGRLHARRA